MTAKIRTPSVHINYQEPYASHEHMARALSAGIEHTYLHEVVRASEVIWCPQGTPVDGPDADMVRLHRALFDEVVDASSGVIRLVLDRKLM